MRYFCIDTKPKLLYTDLKYLSFYVCSLNGIFSRHLKTSMQWSSGEQSEVHSLLPAGAIKPSHDTVEVDPRKKAGKSLLDTLKRIINQKKTRSMSLGMMRDAVCSPAPLTPTQCTLHLKPPGRLF